MKHPLRFPAVTMLALLLASTSLTRRATAQDTASPHEQHVIVNASDLTWSEAAGLPPGAEITVLEGNPAEAGPFTMRARMPDGYRVAPHWHPAVEHVTVLSGTFHVGMGEKMDTSAGKALTAGGFMAMPAEERHYAWVTGETVLQLHGIGPWGITYVNPEDDPRNKAQ